MKQHHSNRVPLRFSGESRLLQLYALIRALCAAGALVFLARFVCGRLQLKNPLGRFSSFGRLVKYGFLGGGAAAGIVLLLFVLLGACALLCLLNKKSGVKLGRGLMVALGAVKLLSCAGILAGGLILLPRLGQTKLLMGDDETVLYCALAALCGYLLLSAVSLFAAASKRKPALPMALCALWVLLCGAALYYFDTDGTRLFSYTLSHALPFELKSEYTLYAFRAACLLSAKYALLWLDALKKNQKRAVYPVFRAVSALLMGALLCAFLREFLDLLGRMNLYSRRISAITKLKHPLCMLGCALTIAGLNLRRGRAFLFAGALTLCLTKALVLYVDTPYMTLKSFNAAFETCLPALQAILWGALALFALVSLLIGKRSFPAYLRFGLAALMFVPPVLAFVYYADKLEAMIARAGALSVIEQLAVKHLLPSAATASAAVCTGIGK